MSRLAPTLLLVLAACANPNGTPRTYDNNELEGITAYTAKSACSCLWVSKMPDAYCRATVKESPDVAKFVVDSEAKTVVATALLSWSAKARFVDDRRGCVLE